MKLIDKDTLVAKIEKLEKALKNACEPNPFGNIEECMTAAELEALNVVKEIINTLEVKEVDLEKEIDKFYGIYRKDGKTYSIEDNEECFDWKEDCNPDFEIAFAKHFFELGMAAFDTVKHS